MNKINLIPKKLKQRFLSINNLLESYFSKLNLLKKYPKKNNILANNKVFFGLSAIIILTLSYFLLPTLYFDTPVHSDIWSSFLCERRRNKS